MLYIYSTYAYSIYVITHPSSTNLSASIPHSPRYYYTDTYMITISYHLTLINIYTSTLFTVYMLIIITLRNYFKLINQLFIYFYDCCYCQCRVIH